MLKFFCTVISDQYMDGYQPALLLRKRRLTIAFASQVQAFLIGMEIRIRTGI